MDGVGEPSLIIEDSTSPHSFTLKPSHAKLLEEADLIFWVGEGIDTFMERPLESIVKNAEVVEFMEVESIEKLKFREESIYGDHDDHDDHDGHDDHDDHDDHAGHEGHDHGEFDPHFWFDIDRVILATEKISQTLVALDSENEKSYVDNQSAYAKKLADFATQTKEKIDNSMISSIPFITMHESLGYLITKYSLTAAGSVYAYNLEDLEITSSKYIEMLDVINDSKANFLIVEDNVAKKMADSMVDDTGITLITGMTVENMKSADQSYIDWIENNVSILVEGLSAK